MTVIGETAPAIERMRLTRLRMAAERAMRPRFGPCLGCSMPTADLLPGREAGFHVYCATCAIIDRPRAATEDYRG